MDRDRMQLQRFELKYLIPEGLTSALRDFVQPYLELDPHAAGQPDLSYSIHSLYLDSDALALYWDTVNGAKNRYKLRLRFYTDQPEAPIFFEIKRRMNDAILKQRGPVRRQVIPQVLAGQLPEPRHLLSGDPRHFAAVQRFCDLMLRVGARPKTHIAYRREAWISPADDSIRVTMDRNIRSEPEPAARLSTQMQNPVRLFGSHVVLEIKFTGRFPDWLSQMVRVFGLERASASKYVQGVSRLGEERLRAPLVPRSLPGPDADRPQPAKLAPAFLRSPHA